METGMYIKGIVLSRNVYEGKNGNIYSLDLGMIGSRQAINVKVDLDRYNKAVEGKVVNLEVEYSENKYGPIFRAK